MTSYRPDPGRRHGLRVVAAMAVAVPPFVRAAGRAKGEAPARGWASVSMRFGGYLNATGNAAPMRIAAADYTFEVLDGARYRVVLQVDSALAALRYESEGLIGAAGLRPRAYRETRRLPLRSPRTREVAFADTEQPGHLVLPAGAQDRLSVIAQLSWLARTQPRPWATAGQAPLMLAGWDSVEPTTITIGEPQRVSLENGAGVQAREYRRLSNGGGTLLEFWLIDDAQRSPAIISFAEGDKRLRFVRILD
ncbi:MAG: hypothetical protein QM766_01345 [Burkholderiaceae bacterium]